MCDFSSWPIQPRQITNNKEFEFNGPGIIPNKYLKGVLLEMTVSLKHPVTCIEFLPDNYLRTDGDTQRIRHKPNCLKDECKDSGCLYYIACNHKFIENISSCNSVLTTQDCDYIFNSFILCNQSNNEIPEKISLGVFYAYPYHCKINNFYEYAIPIFYRKNILAIIFIGNIKSLNKIDSQIKVQLKEFYRTLVTEIDEIAKNYVSKRIDQISWNLRDDFFLKPIPPGNLGLIRFWKKVENSLKLLIEHFPAEFFIILAKDTFTTKNGMDILHSVASVGYNIKYSSIKFNPEKIGDYDTIMKAGVLNITSTIYPELAGGLESDILTYNKETDILRFFPSHYSPRSNYLIWIRYNKSQWDRLEEISKKSAHDQIFENSILLFYSLLGSIYSSVLSEFSSELFELTIRIISHELSQNLIVIDAIRDSYIENGEILRKTHSLKDINEDLQSQITQIEYIDLNSKSIIKKDRIIEISEVSPIKDLLYRWANTYKRLCLKRKISIVTPNYVVNYDHPVVHTDPLIIDQVVYNVINNAIKYSHFGTKIHCDYFRSVANPNIVCITVKDYGKTAPPDDRIIYNLFERGDNIEGIEGLGVGLGIAKQNLTLIGGSIRHESKIISIYNIPVLVYYIRNINQLPRLDNHTDYLSEYNKLNDNLINEIVLQMNKKFTYRPGFEEITETINDLTVEVKFFIEFNVNLKIN